MLVAAGVLGVLALGRLLDGAGTQVGKADDRSLAPHSAAGEPVHEAREGKLVPRDGAAAPGEPGTPPGHELEGTEASTAVSGGAAAPSEPEPRSTPARRRSGSEPVDAPVADAPVADVPAIAEPPDELESMRLLREAERKLETDAAESLRLLERHAERFPSSPLSLEREALTVIALCRVGRVEAGRERQQAFLRRPGSSAYAKRVKSACEATASPAP